jgi:hypothetical protein
LDFTDRASYINPHAFCLRGCGAAGKNHDDVITDQISRKCRQTVTLAIGITTYDRAVPALDPASRIMSSIASGDATHAAFRGGNEYSAYSVRRTFKSRVAR